MTTWFHEQRLAAVLGAIRSCGAGTVLDLGCGDGALLIRLLREPGIRRVVGIDLSADALRALERRLARLPPEATRKVSLFHGSMTEPDPVLRGYDAALLVETIEHIDPDRLSILERAVFRELSPETVIVTTPNSEFNGLLGVPGHRFRHPGHRFEWDRAKFRSWARGVAGRNGYRVTFEDVAGAHPTYGGASQMAVFRQPTGNTAAA
jgi:small RNA 2'-O-methyltransferase